MPANNSVIPIRAFRQGDQQNGNVNAIGELQTGEKIGIQHINTGTLATNTAFQSALANTNAYIASVAASGGEVANAYLTSTFTTNTVFQSALANTNAYIASSAGSASFPFFVGGSSVSTIPISDGVFPFFNSAGNADNIGATGDIVTDTTPQLGGNLDLNSRDITGTGNITITGNYTGTGNITNTGNFDLISTDAGSSAAPELTLYRNSSSPADSDYLGQIRFEGENDAGQNQLYAKITGKISDASDGTEDGILEIAHVKAGSQNISARFTSSTLKLLNGTTLELKGQDSDTRYANSTIATPRTGANNSVKIPYGTTGERDGSPDTGFFRYNVTTASAEIYDGSAWGEVGGGGGASGAGGDAIFYENGQTVTTNYSITSSTNAMSTGPLTINSGVSVTVPSGSRLVVL